ncbi:response regulator transcription factor [Enterococcus eurekensis]|uniref:Response regulator transcription factor n=2 Tax=Enterococcus TaxID=1350 RepID=A0ABV9M5F3_9ENTE|nr:response regulator transcription factor [Candidatus Enterococcus avicola]
MSKLLIVDDNQQITSILADYAKKNHYDVLIAYDGEAALELFQTAQPDIILLDVMMPKKDGFAVCREIRQTSNVPILMITARGEDFERIMGLEIGADDYIVKPFSPGEVMARIKAVMRRVQQDPMNQQQLTFNDLTINLENYTVAIANEPILLTKKEIDLLWTLASNRQKAYSRDELLNLLWGFDYFGDTRTVDSHIKRLRSKLNQVPHPTWEIKTIWGVGYKFEVLDDEN